MKGGPGISPGDGGGGGGGGRRPEGGKKYPYNIHSFI